MSEFDANEMYGGGDRIVPRYQGELPLGSPPAGSPPPAQPPQSRGRYDRKDARVRTKAQREKLKRFLPRVCKLDDRGFAVYTANWNDNAVADYMKIKKHHVASARNLLVGRLAHVPPPLPKKKAEQAPETTPAMRQLRELEAAIQDVKTVINNHATFMADTRDALAALSTRVDLLNVKCD